MKKKQSPFEILVEVLESPHLSDQERAIVTSKIKLVEGKQTLYDRLVVAGIPQDKAKEYEVLFEKNDIDHSLLGDLDEERLKAIGVDSMGHRLKMLKSFKISRTITDKN